MSKIKYYTLGKNEEVPYEFVVIRNVNGEPELYASFVNTNSLAYGNDVLLKFHKRNDELRAENAKLREFATEMWELLTCNEPVFVWKGLQEKARELGVEVTDGY